MRVKEVCGAGGMRNRRDAVLEGYRKSGMQERRDAGKKRCKK